MVAEHLEFKLSTTIKEILFLVWAIIIVINAHDDISPTWDLTTFWVLSILTIVCRFFIMAIEMSVFLTVVKNACIKNSLLNYKKDDIRVEEAYVQQGFNDHHEPLETEERGLNYD